MNLASLLEETYRRYWKGNKDANGSYRQGQHVVEYFGEDCEVQEISEKEIDTWMDLLRADGKSNGTINRRVAALSRMLIHSHRMGYISRVPKIVRAKEPKGRIAWLQKEEEAEMLAIPMDDWFKDLIVILLDTGMRLGEALKLQAKDVDKKRGVVHLWENKNGESRTVPLTSRALEALKGKKGQVFPVSASCVQWHWSKLRKAMNRDGDADFIIHMLRHTCASRLVQNGVAITVVKEFLGHKNINTTMRYAHISADNLSAAAATLEA